MFLFAKEVITIKLSQYGFDDTIKYYYNQNNHNQLDCGRVTKVERGLYQVQTDLGSKKGYLSGTFKHDDLPLDEFPAIGDFVYIKKIDEQSVQISQIVPRKNSIKRKARGTLKQTQVIAANIDYCFIVTSANKDFNIRRIERYISSIYDSKIKPVIILSKIDLDSDYSHYMNLLVDKFPYTDIIAISAYMSINMEQLYHYLTPGLTSVFIGSSGVGKSTIINHVLKQEILETKEIRMKDDRGRHTTTHRELFLTLNGSVIIDTPGMRSLSLWDFDEDSADDAFSKIAELSEGCRFRDCTHTKEPKCNVIEALQNGELDEKEYISYHKLQKEIKYLQRKNNR